MVEKTKETNQAEASKYTNNRASNPGTKFVSGRIYEEYLGALTTPAASYPIYDKMRRSDYQIKRLLNVLMTPIKSGTFKYSPKDDKDEKQIEQAYFKNQLLNNWGTQKWSEMLHEILSFLPMGFSIFEPYSHVVEDVKLGSVVTLKSLGFLKQSTIDKWDVKDAEVVSILQKAYGKNDVTIKGDELMIFTNEKEGDNFEGISVLRAAYGNYIRKDLYLRLDMIGQEKMSVGTPIFFLPKSMILDDTELAAVKAVGESYTSHEQAFVILDERLKEDGFMIEKGEYNSEAVDTSIKREDMGILDSILAGFLAIGTQKSGGNAQNEGQMEMFLNSLLFIGKYIASKIDPLTHSYYVLNFGEPEERLDMLVTGIARKDARAMMEVMRGYVTSKIIQPDDRLEKRVRDDLNLPDIDDTSIRDINETPDYKEDQDDQDKENPDKQKKPAESPDEGK